MVGLALVPGVVVAAVVNTSVAPVVEVAAVLARVRVAKAVKPFGISFLSSWSACLRFICLGNEKEIIRTQERFF